MNNSRFSNLKPKSNFIKKERQGGFQRVRREEKKNENSRFKKLKSINDENKVNMLKEVSLKKEERNERHEKKEQFPNHFKARNRWKNSMVKKELKKKHEEEASIFEEKEDDFPTLGGNSSQSFVPITMNYSLKVNEGIEREEKEKQLVEIKKREQEKKEQRNRILNSQIIDVKHNNRYDDSESDEEEELSYGERKRLQMIDAINRCDGSDEESDDSCFNENLAGRY